jgi:chemotaxis family two-component system response regulator Rcp1
MNPVSELDRPVETLLVEDNEADIRLTREVFADGRILNKLSVVRDGEEAMAFLKRRAPFAGAPRPDLVLLDLNLPRKDGREVLAEMKNDEELRRIPVVILTTSRAEADVIRTYELHANCYIVKPVDLSQFINVVRSIEDFWLKLVRLPTPG